MIFGRLGSKLIFCSGFSAHVSFFPVCLKYLTTERAGFLKSLWVTGASSSCIAASASSFCAICMEFYYYTDEKIQYSEACNNDKRKKNAQAHGKRSIVGLTTPIDQLSSVIIWKEYRQRNLLTQTTLAYLGQGRFQKALLPTLQIRKR